MDFEQELKANEITLNPFVMVIGGALRIPGKNSKNSKQKIKIHQ